MFTEKRRETLKMDPKEKKRKLSKSEMASPSSSSISKMDLKKKKKKKQKISKSQVIASPSTPNKDLVITTSPSLSKKDLEQAMKKQIDAAMFFAGKVISTVAKNSNFVFSPASINSALTIVAATSDLESLRSLILSLLRSSSTDELNAVFREIASVVLVDGSTSGGPKIAGVNGVWMEQSLPVKSSVKDLFENFFKASFALVDFRFKAEETRRELNAWAKHHTNGLIKDLLPPRSIKDDTEYVYGNALYFKGVWEHKFPKSMTRNQKFHLLRGSTVSVPFMSNNKRQYVKAYDGFKVLQLPFRQGGDINRTFSMHFYLPDAKDGLDTLVKKMTSTPGFVDDHIPSSKVLVGDFRIPKFKIEFGFEVSKVFDEMEVALYHKAFVEIDEDGAEAAAATFTSMGGSRFIPQHIDFVADHPFLFLIRENKAGTVLFVGQIFDPSKSCST